MSKLVQVLRDNADLLNNLYGNTNDLIVKSRFGDIMSEFSAYEKQKAEYDRYNSIADKIATVNLGDEDYYNVDKSKAINYDDDKFKQSKAFTSYNDQLTQDYLKNNPDDPNGEKMNLTFTGEDFTKYLEQNPDYLNEVNSNYLTDVENKRLKNKDELTNHIYTKAGLQPEDIDFYSNYKPLNPSEFNSKLSNLVFDEYNNLTSTGSYQDRYAKALQNKASLTGIVPQKVDYDYKEVNGKLVQINKTTGKIKEVYGEGNRDKIRLLSGEERYIKDGNKFYKEYPTFNDTKGELGKPQRVEVTEAEYNKSQDKLMTNEELLALRQKFRPKTGKKGGTAPAPSSEVLRVGTALTKLAEYNKTYKNIFNEDGTRKTGKKEQAENYKTSKEILIPYFKGNWDELNKFAEDLDKMNPSAKRNKIEELVKNNTGNSEINTESELEISDNLFSEGDEFDTPEIYDAEIDYFDQGLSELETGEQMTLWLKDFESRSKSSSAKEYAQEKYLNAIGNDLRTKQKNRTK